MEIDNEDLPSGASKVIPLESTPAPEKTIPTVPTAQTAHSWGKMLPVAQPSKAKEVPQKKNTSWNEATTNEELEAAKTEDTKKPKSKDWPPALCAYAERAFAQYTDEYSKSKVEEKLRKMIMKCYQNNTLFTADWDNETLPTADEDEKITYTKSKWTLGAPVAKAAPLNNRKKVLKIEENSEDFIPVQDVPAYPPVPTISDSKTIAKRKMRFANSVGESDNDTTNENNGIKSESVPKPRFKVPKSIFSSNESTWEDMTVVGTCQKLEKTYLRLTSAPDPSVVRPEPVLKQALEMVKDRWKKNEDWQWCCEQMKSIRQDLTVQQIKNTFTVQVYEHHARLCLENNDIGEYNQCQSQLLSLYKMKIPGARMEFIAYRILYSLYENNPLNANRMLAELTTEMKKDPGVIHALMVRKAFAIRNYHAFF
uniref:SAC3/GANP/THP3 conserved domain-containing protein n=1 Tax=Arcella intermedia TaxID=1963864 RepID=A0A6B2L178_9EUKA